MDPIDSIRALAVPPAELVGPLPRNVKLNSTNGKFGLLFVLSLFATCAYFAVTFGSEAIRQTQQRALLRGNSRDVVGKVTGFHVVRFTPLVVKYSFTFDGKPYFGEAKEPNAVGPWTALRRSDPISIRFLPANPAISHPAAWEWSALIYRDEIIFVIFLLAMGSMVLAILARERKLAREGKAALGVVTSCTPWNREFRVEYEFCTEDGVLLKGKSGCADPFEPGARIWILYLPRKPERNHCYPLEMYSVAD